MFIKYKYIITLYTLTRGTWIVSAGWDYVSSYVVRDVCIHNPDDINNWEHITEVSCYCLVVLLQQCGLFSLTFVFWNFNYWSVRCAYGLSFNKNCENGTLVLKRSGWYVICIVVRDWFYCFLMTSFCWIKCGL